MLFRNALLGSALAPRLVVLYSTRSGNFNHALRLAVTFEPRTRPSTSVSTNGKLISVKPLNNFRSCLMSTGHKDNDGSDGKPIPFTDKDSNTEEIETHGQPMHRFSSSNSLEQASQRHDLNTEISTGSGHSSTQDYQSDMSSDQHVDVYNHSPSVNLSSCMQSQVPEPYGKTPSHMNMPGGVNRREDKYTQGRLTDLHQYKRYSTSTQASVKTESGMIDEHGNTIYASQILETPCPQGVQGEDCAQFKLWLSNCLSTQNRAHCEELANEYIAGRRSLAQVFAEYDIEVRKAASNHKLSRGQVREYSAGDANSRSQGPPSDGPPPSNKNERVQKLKAAVRDYGSTVIVFHVGISLMSLGGFYLLVASNVDVIALLSYLPFDLGSTTSSLETASTFAVAYGIHKLFAPVRIMTTLTCAPILVRAMRARGILKPPKI